MIFIPLKSPTNEEFSHFFRFVTFLKESEGEGPREPDQAYIQSLLQSRVVGDVPFTVSQVVTGSRYTVRCAVTDKLFHPVGSKGKIILAGDAAHVHSPAGAQGLNLGICDAVALARAITAHSKSNGDDSILSSFADRRRARAVEVVGLASGITNLNAMGSGWRRVVRNAGMYLMGSITPIVKKVALKIAGLNDRDVAI
jgi:2-polyprenyl-6-methoxyphenol hydroxylase-like FAD-dependent oxidoreductase